MKVPPPFVPGSEFAGVVTEVGDDVDGLAVGDRVFGTTLVGAFAEEAVRRGDVAHADARRGRRSHRRRASASPTAPRTTCCARWPGCSRATSSSCSAPAAASGSPPSSSAAVLGATVTAVASSAEKLDVAAVARRHAARSTTGPVDLRQALREALPDGADVVVDPVGGDLAEPALRSLRYGGRFVTVGYASGVIPRIPLNLVLLKGMQVLGFEFARLRDPRARRDGPQRGRAARPARRTAATSAHIGATFALDDVAAALRHVADGRAIGKVVLDVAPPAT